MLRHTSSIHTRRCWKRLVSPTARLSSCCEVIKTARFVCFCLFPSFLFPVHMMKHTLGPCLRVPCARCCQQRALKHSCFVFPFFTTTQPPSLSLRLVFLTLQRETRWEKVRDTNLTRPHAVEPVLRFCSELLPRNVAEKQTITHLKMCVHVRQIHFPTILHVFIILPPTHHTLPH